MVGGEWANECAMGQRYSKLVLFPFGKVTPPRIQTKLSHSWNILARSQQCHVLQQQWQQLWLQRRQMKQVDLSSILALRHLGNTRVMRYLRSLWCFLALGIHHLVVVNILLHVLSSRTSTVHWMTASSHPAMVQRNVRHLKLHGWIRILQSGHHALHAGTPRVLT